MKKFLCVLALLPILCGCTGFDLKKYDEITVAQIEITIDHEKADYEAVKAALVDLQAPEIVLADLAVRFDAELKRLQMWLEYERAKKIDEPAQPAQ